MAQRERADEVAARRRVEATLEVGLTFADQTGGVDYRFERDGHEAALEVVRLTDAAWKEGKVAWAARGQCYEAPVLAHSWWLVTDGHPTYKDLGQHLVTALACLERHHLLEFQAEMVWWLRHVPTLREALAALTRAKVTSATHIMTEGPTSQVHLSPSGGWMSDGPNGAIEELEAFLANTTDVLKKLGESGAVERHAWVWTDGDSPGRVRRPLEGPDLRLPTVDPSLPQEVTAIWVGSELSGRAWSWSSGTGWTWAR